MGAYGSALYGAGPYGGGSAFADTVTATDALSRVWAAKLTISDTAQVSSSITLPGANNWSRAINDTATLTDARSRAITSRVTDLAVLADVASAGYQPDLNPIRLVFTEEAALIKGREH